MKKVFVMVVFGLFFGLLGQNVLAGEVADVLKLKRQIIEIQNKGTLGIQEFTLCNKILNYASYYPLDGNVVKKGSKLKVYYEPFSWFTSTKEERYEFWLTQDIRIESSTGEVLFAQGDLLDLHYNTRKPILDVYVTNNFDLGEMPQGKYRYIVVLHDKISGQKAEHSQDFEISK